MDLYKKLLMYRQVFVIVIYYFTLIDISSYMS